MLLASRTKRSRARCISLASVGNAAALNVRFRTYNEKRLILSDTGRLSEDEFLVDDVTYARRLAKAFRHAVELCGGKASPF